MKKRKGIMLFTVSLIMCLIVSLIAVSIVEIQIFALKEADASGIGFEANFLAMNKINEIRVTPYENLSAMQMSRSEIKNTEFDLEVLMGPEKTGSYGRERKMTVNVYKKGENAPRYSASLTPAIRETVFWSGMIMIYSGERANIPAGWTLCDGTNGTLDLRDKFIVMYGKNQDKVSGNVKNFLYKSMEENFKHQHKTFDHKLTIDEMPKHRHSLDVPDKGRGGKAPKIPKILGNKSIPYIPTGNAGEGKGHNHGDTYEEYHLPPYYVLAYIMKQ